MRTRKVSQFWTVRNKQGQYMGCFAAYTGEAAIRRFLESEAQYRTTFKRTKLKHMQPEDFTAAVEQPKEL